MKFFLVVFLIAGVSCLPKDPINNLGQNDGSSPLLLSDAINAFNSKFFKSLTTTEVGNIIYSPFSLHMLFSQVYFGSPIGTTTNNELASLLAFDPSESNNQAYLNNYLQVINHLQQEPGKLGSEVSIANRFFPAQDMTIKSGYKETMRKFFNSDVENVDFHNAIEAARIINTFVSDKTQGLIEKILESADLDDLTRLVMVNAVYFKGLWMSPFKANVTTTLKFHVDSEREVDFAAMRQTLLLKWTIVDEINAEVFELPYKNNSLSMVVVVPSKNSDIKEIGDKLENFDVSKIKNKLDQVEYAQARLVFPKFEAEYTCKALKKILKDLGVKDIFAAPNLSNITNENMFVSQALHKAFIKVNEEGSEAAAITAIVAETRTGPPWMIVDRPFIFYIYDIINGIPLFAGRIVDPNGKLTLD